LTGFGTDWDLGSDGGEEGLYSTQQLVSGGNLVAARNQGFFRNDAALTVIFIADENDICAIYPAGITPAPDPEGREARARDCGGVTSAGVLNQLTGLKGNMPVVVGGVLYTNPGAVPAGAENEVGYGYLDIISLANGTAVELSNVGGIAPGVGGIGETSALDMLLYHDFKLSYGGVVTDTIKASVDSASVPHMYAVETHTVHLERAGDFGSRVSIDYCESR
jgi:hypothetical protein